MTETKSKINHYCTLFDTAYLSRGLTMYYSILDRTSDFHMYIYAFDDKCYDFLSELKLNNATIISLKEFEDKELLAVKKDRSHGEYCWTCTPSIILHSISTFNLANCTYIDADLYFFSDPQILLDEIKDNSIMISEHRYSKPSEQEKIRGKYCVQFMTFLNDKNGLEALSWWRERCIEWCFSFYEKGKFGDQLYLDDWLERFSGVHVMQNQGGGLAPWNMDQYLFKSVKNTEVAINKKTLVETPVVFFHFHSLKIFLDDTVKLTYYRMSNDIIQLIYKAYITRLLTIEKMILESGSIDIHDLRDQPITFNLINFFRILKHKLLRIDNSFNLGKII